MRVSCIFVFVATMLAGEIQSVPILGIDTVPLLGNESRLINGVSSTLHPVPLAGQLTGHLLQGSANGDVLSAVGQAGGRPLGPLGGVVGSLQRRQATSLIGTLGGLANGVQGMPVLGSVGSTLPVTQAITSKVGSLNGALPDMKDLGTGLHKALPPTDLSAGLLKRDANTSALGSIPLIGSLPGASSLPLISSLPSFSSLPLISSVPKLNSLPLISSVPGISKLSSGFPSPASLGSFL